MIREVGKVVATLNPNDVALFCRELSSSNLPSTNIKHRLLEDVDDSGLPRLDLNPMPYAPFIKSSPTDKPILEPAEKHLCILYNDGSVEFRETGVAKKDSTMRLFQAAPDFPLDYEYLATTKDHPLIVDPYAAALALYDPSIGMMEKVETSHFRDKANQKVMEYLISGGVSDPRVKNLLGLAVMMDTASRTPSIMTPDFIEYAIRWYAENANGADLWIGGGSEHYKLDAKDRVGALAPGGKADRKQYIEARIIQLELIQGLGHTPILFPDVMHHGLGDKTNAEIIRRVLVGKEKEVVLHKLGSPFVRETDWFTLGLLQDIAGIGKAVKTSNPIFKNQVDDYNAIMAGNGALYTGDDRNFGLVWLWAAMKQLEEGNPNPNTYERNRFYFIKDKNANALLGYIGLNPKQTIAAITKLSKWYHEKAKGPQCSNAIADEHLGNYLEIIIPAMGMSIDAFFSKYNHTPAYTGYVELASRYAGVITENDGRPLPHRRSLLDRTEDQKLINGRFLVWQILSGAVPSDKIEEAVANNKDSLVIG